MHTISFDLSVFPAANNYIVAKIVSLSTEVKRTKQKDFGN